MSAQASLEKISSTLSRLEASLDRIEKKLGTSGSASGEEKPFVREFDNLVVATIMPYLELSNKLGSDIAEHAKLVNNAIEALKQLLVVASTTKKPEMQGFQKALTPLSQAIGAVKDFKDKNNRSKNPNHLAAIAEGISALGWVAESLPAPFVGEMKGSSEFWSNRILKEFKGKDETQCDWVKHWNTFLKDLQVYVKQYHTTGLAWSI